MSDSKIYFLAFIFFKTSASTLMTVAEFLAPFLWTIIELPRDALLNDRLGFLGAAGENKDFETIDVVSFKLSKRF